MAGSVLVDDGAVRAIRKHKSLFAAGVVQVTGQFGPQEAVRICDSTGIEIARGLSNFGHEELLRIRGRRSHELDGLLGYCAREAVVDRANLVLPDPSVDEVDAADAGRDAAAQGAAALAGEDLERRGGDLAGGDSTGEASTAASAAASAAASTAASAE